MPIYEDDEENQEDDTVKRSSPKFVSQSSNKEESKQIAQDIKPQKIPS